MRKWVLIVFLGAAMLLAQAALPGSQAGRDDGIGVVLNGKTPTLSAGPVMKDGSVYVPLRSFLAALGADVHRDETTGVITVEHNGTVIQIKIGSRHGSVDGKPVALEKPPVLLSGTTYVSVRWLNETLGAVVKWHAGTRTVAVYYPDKQLPRVESYKHLKTLLTEAAEKYGYGYLKAAMATENAAAADSASDDSGASAGYSATNTQVQGVDEADVVKTDGNYIYQVNRQRIVITSAKPADRMKTVASLNYGDGSFTPQEIYVDNKRLVVIGTGSPLDRELPAGSMVENKKMILPPQPYVSTTKAIVYDITDKSLPKQIRELELEGGYLASRKIGDSLYLISNKYADYYHIMNEKDAAPAPMFRDSAVNGKLTEIDYSDIRYFPGFVEPNYMLVAGVDLADTGKPMDVQTFLGSGQNVYASADHLYVAVTRYEPPAADQQPQTSIAPGYGQSSTAIYKFALNSGSVVYMAEGKVPGTIVNQFSMDEYDGYFRIATTTGDTWGSGQSLSKNNLYVLSDALAETGKIENIAPGERIYSVRFIGKRAFMVTFRTVDPLFVLDVANPAQPKIVGALKIPGYSDYLHPYDDNLLIGFGKDTVEVVYKDDNGNAVNTNAYYLGMKAALFDVTDVEHPKELHKVIIGDRGTYSELLHNHKALLFSKEKNLLAFPVDLYEVKGKSGAADAENPMPEYGTFTYQGAYVYKIDPAHGFQLLGTITHMSQDDIDKSGNIRYGDKNVRRILYIGDTLYTLSDGLIKANSLTDLREIGSLHIPGQ